MDFELLPFLVGFPSVYVAGILTHKYVIDQAEKAGDPGNNSTSWTQAFLQFPKTAAGTPSG